MLGFVSLTESALRHGPWLVFVFLFGACVGSFLNVVNWRLPRGMSLSHPPSRCPTCGGRLRFIRENLPILGWILLRGQCRFCKAPISPVYPIVELCMALVFAGLYVCLFMVDPADTLWWEGGGSWWLEQQFTRAWPAYVAVAFMIAGLFSMTVIDARTYLIPLAIPVFVTCAAIVLWLIESMVATGTGPRALHWPIPGTGWVASGSAVGGMLGVGVSMTLLMTGRIRPSFADYEDYVPEGDTLAEYPHARREMALELLFLAPIVAGIVLGGWALAGLDGVPPRWLQALGGSLAGWLVGGGLVWAVRILGTLAFGREAMGLGDVHLLAAVGAVLGWFLPILIFFLAPFIGLAWTLVVVLLSRFGGKAKRELPYGPHLAVATVLLLCSGPLVKRGWRILMPTVEMPKAGLVEPVDNSRDWTRSRGAVSMQTGAEAVPTTDGTTDRCGKETRPCA